MFVELENLNNYFHICFTYVLDRLSLAMVFINNTVAKIEF